jgi:hypothetical protein
MRWRRLFSEVEFDVADWREVKNRHHSCMYAHGNSNRTNSSPKKRYTTRGVRVIHREKKTWPSHNDAIHSRRKNIEKTSIMSGCLDIQIKHLEKSASVAARLGVAGSSSLLEPGNEGLEGEGLGKLSTAGRSGGSASSGCSLGDRRGSSRSRGSSRRSSGGGSSGSSRSSSGGAVARGAGGRRRAGAGAAGPESRAGDLVVDGGGVGVEDDAILVSSVEAGANNTLGGLSSGSGDLVTVS